MKVKGEVLVSSLVGQEWRPILLPFEDVLHEVVHRLTQHVRRRQEERRGLAAAKVEVGQPHARQLSRPAFDLKPAALLARVVDVVAPAACLAYVVPPCHIAVAVFVLLLVRIDKEPLHQQLAQYTWSTR